MGKRKINKLYDDDDDDDDDDDGDYDDNNDDELVNITALTLLVIGD